MSGDIPTFTHTSSWHGAYLSTGEVFMVWDSVKHSDNFTFTSVIQSRKATALVCR